MSVFGTWVHLEELVCFVALVSNTYLLYEVSPTFKRFCEENKISEWTGSSLYTCVVLQNALVLLIILFRWLFSDSPKSTALAVKGSDPKLKAQLEELQRQNDNMRKQLTEPSVTEGKLSHFLGLNKHEFFSQRYESAVETALQVNFNIRLFRETFYLLERAILTEKLAKINKQSRTLQVNCCDCKQKAASVFCGQCEDYRCGACSSETHKDPQTKTHEPK